MNIRNIPQELKHPDVSVQLSGEDGNVYSILGRCKREIHRKKGAVAADAWRSFAMSECASYDEVLAFCMETLDTR